MPVTQTAPVRVGSGRVGVSLVVMGPPSPDRRDGDIRDGPHRRLGDP